MHTLKTLGHHFPLPLEIQNCTDAFFATQVVSQGRDVICSARIIIINGFTGSLIWAPRFNASDCQLHICMYILMWCMHMSLSTHLHMCGGQCIFLHRSPHSFNIELFCVLGDGVHVQARGQLVGVSLLLLVWGPRNRTVVITLANAFTDSAVSPAYLSSKVFPKVGSLTESAAHLLARLASQWTPESTPLKCSMCTLLHSPSTWMLGIWNQAPWLYSRHFTNWAM